MAEHAAEAPKGALVNDVQYDFLKALAQYVLPALATLYVALAGLWGLPYVTEVVGTVTAVDTFLGVILGLLKKQYNSSDAPYDGQLVVDSSQPGKDVFSLVANGAIEDLAQKKQITFKVQPPG